MSTLYFDSSALAKRYLTEAGTKWVTSLLDPSIGHSIIVATITRVETAAAIAARQRAGGITLAERNDLVDLLLRHFDSQYQIVPLEPSIISHAVELTQAHRLRGYDAVQLAVALDAQATLLAAGLPALTLVSADDDLNAAAQLEGLAAENPNAYP